jgi:rare lipoprotein A
VRTPTGVARLLVLAVVPVFAVACAGRPSPTTLRSATIGAEQRGLASWYGHPYHGRRTTSGEIYDMHQMTAAHRRLPFGTWLHVENLDTGQTARVRVNDRGPFVGNRILDVSRAAGVALGAIGPGVIPVRLRVIAPPSGAATPPADGATSFVVQVGAFTAEDGAITLRQALSRAGFAEAEVVRVEVNGEALYRVRAGRFATRPAADAQVDRLARAGYAAIVATE